MEKYASDNEHKDCSGKEQFISSIRNDFAKLQLVLKDEELEDIIKRHVKHIENSYIGIEYVDVCRTIRRYAAEKKIVIMNEKQTIEDAQAINIFKMIEACGVNVVCFVTEFLCVLQPYQLQKFTHSNIYCCYIAYDYQLVIKLDDSGEQDDIIVSLYKTREENFRLRRYKVRRSMCKCVCFVDEEDIGMSFMTVTAQHGFLRCTDEYFVRRYDEEDKWVLEMYTSIDDNNDWVLINYDSIDCNIDKCVGSAFKQISNIHSNHKLAKLTTVFWGGFLEWGALSDGENMVNFISRLIDLYSSVCEIESLSVLVATADMVLRGISENRLEELCLALRIKYGNSGNKLYAAIMNYI